MKKNTTIGIQGGFGSYNHVAIKKQLDEQYDLDTIIFLDSTPNVFEALFKNEIDCGQFAVHNSFTGFYQESLTELAKNTFTILDIYAIPVNHVLMIHKEKLLSEIKQIITHKEVIKQCSKTLRDRYGGIDVHYTTGDLVDPSNMAKQIASNSSYRNTATLGNPILAEIHDLRIVDRSMSDDGESESTFFLVGK